MKLKWAGLLFGSLLIVLSACGNEQTLLTEVVMADESNETEEAEVIAETDVFEDIRQQSFDYMQDPQFDVITAKELNKEVIFRDSDDYLILDMRDTTTFAKGNIQGSVNIPYRISGKEKMITQLPKDKTIYVICFSGHTASQTVGFLNVLGYDAQALQFGMGGYASGTDLGSNVPGKAAGFVVDKNDYLFDETFDFSEITYPEDMDTNQVIMSQSQRYLDKEKPAVVSAPEVKEMVEAKGEFDDYQLVDIRLHDDYARGHVPKAVNIPYTDLFKTEQLEKLNPDKTTILIGYNGYDASQVTRLLNNLEISAVPMGHGMTFWSGDEEVIGQAPLDFKEIDTFPTQELNFDLEGGDVQTSCS